MCIFNSDLQGHLETLEEQISRQKQVLKEASAKHQVYTLYKPIDSGVVGYLHMCNVPTSVCIIEMESNV